MNFLDLIIIGALLLGGLSGYRKGLINSVVGVLVTLSSLIIAFLTYRILTPILNTQLGVGQLVQNILKNTMALPAAKMEPLGKGNPLDKLSLITNGLPQGLQKEFNQMFINMLNSYIGTTIKTIGDAIIQYFTLIIVSMFAFLIIFIVANILIRSVANALTKGLGTHFVGAVNNSGGFVAGGLAGFLFVSILTGFIVPLFALYSPTLTRLVNQSLLVPHLLNFFVGLNNFLGR